MYDLFKNLRNHAEGEGGDTGVSAAPAASEEVHYEYGIESPEQGQEPQQKATSGQEMTWEEAKKRFKKEYGADVQGAVQKRFAGVTKTKSDLGRANGLLARIAERYKVPVNEDGTMDYDKLEEAMDGDNEQYESLADELGVSVEFAKERTLQKRKIARLEAENAARHREEQNFARFQQHQQQAAELQKTFPSFDLLAEMEDRTFTTMLNNGFSVEEAFYTVHRKELMQAGQQAAAKQAAESLTASIMAGQARPSEGGLHKNPAVRTERIADPAKLTREQRKEVRKIAARGGKVAF